MKNLLQIFHLGINMIFMILQFLQILQIQEDTCRFSVISRTLTHICQIQFEIPVEKMSLHLVSGICITWLKTVLFFCILLCSSLKLQLRAATLKLFNIPKRFGLFLLIHEDEFKLNIVLTVTVSKLKYRSQILLIFVKLKSIVN